MCGAIYVQSLDSGFIVQENGWIRNRNGYLVGKICDDIDYRQINTLGSKGCKKDSKKGVKGE